MRWRDVSYSASAGIAVTALARIFCNLGGEIVLVPGMMIEGILSTFISFALTAGDNYFFFPPGSHLIPSAVLYSLASYAVILFIRD